MCGRAKLSTDFSEIKIVFGVPAGAADAKLRAELEHRADRSDARSSLRCEGRAAQSRHHALGPRSYWAKDIKIGYSTFNARAEEIETKPAFREAFQRRRCLIPLDAFYEWQKIDDRKQPYAIGLKDGGLKAMAGLWENWRSLAGEQISLGEEPADAAALKGLLAPYPSDEMVCWPVSARVGNVKNNDPSLIEPLADH
jgi:putative SOS response-associated peptidase YedK